MFHHKGGTLDSGAGEKRENVSMCAYLCAVVRVCGCACEGVRVCAFGCARISVCVWVCACGCVRVSVYVCMCVCVRVCLCVGLGAWVCVMHVVEFVVWVRRFENVLLSAIVRCIPAKHTCKSA